MSGFAVPILETARLWLRPLRSGDFDTFARWCADDGTMRYIGRGTALNRSQAWRVFAFLVGHWQLRGYGQWALEDKATGALVGRAGLHNPEGWPGVEVGWLIGPEMRGLGHATEAGRAALDWAFATLDVAEVISVIHPDNAPSRRVAEKLGESPVRRVEIDDQPADIFTVGRPAAI